MAITSVNDKQDKKNYTSTQLRYAATYVLITFIVLLILNIYSSQSSQELFYKSKEASMVERCLIAASDISLIEVLNTDSVTDAVSRMENLSISRMIVTDNSGKILYDSAGSEHLGDYALFPEILQALDNQDDIEPTMARRCFDFAQHDIVSEPTYPHPLNHKITKSHYHRGWG